MEKKANSLFIKIIKNKYWLIVLFFIVWMLFFDNNSYLKHRTLDNQINTLEETKNFYTEEIIKDSIIARKLNNSFEVEKYAREQYFMKRDSEDIYIIEYQEDEK